MAGQLDATSLLKVDSLTVSLGGGRQFEAGVLITFHDFGARTLRAPYENRAQFAGPVVDLCSDGTCECAA